MLPSIDSNADEYSAKKKASSSPRPEAEQGTAQLNINAVRGPSPRTHQVSLYVCVMYPTESRLQPLIAQSWATCCTCKMSRSRLSVGYITHTRHMMGIVHVIDHHFPLRQGPRWIIATPTAPDHSAASTHTYCSAFGLCWGECWG